MKPKSRNTENRCPVCNGAGSVKNQAGQMSEHYVKNCISYKATTSTCGFCAGTGYTLEKIID
ncbi:MAG: hypothetical protein KGD64_12895 [Candidatus Heimdallarchaeota archaeon]|nr:hypothetical protein [Candidatus Heimdallarchaeota archaeon]